MSPFRACFVVGFVKGLTVDIAVAVRDTRKSRARPAASQAPRPPAPGMSLDERREVEVGGASLLAESD